MKVSATVLFLTAALGASAHPSGHAHRRAHRSADNDKRDFVMAKKPVTVTEYETYTMNAAAAIAAPTTTSVAAPVQPTTTSSSSVAAPPSSSAAAPSSGSGSGSGSSSGSGSGYKPFCGGKKGKRATIAEIAYKGNLGLASDFGCNMMMVDEGVADKYDYTVTFEEAEGKDQTCACWLKYGKDGGINGFFAGNQVLNFDLPANGKKVLAADVNTQGGCACYPGKIPLSKDSQFGSTWTEFDFANESNGGWSGADASCIVSAALDLDIPGLNVCGHGVCSTINPGGTGTNAFLGGTEALDGLGLNIAPGQARLVVTVGYKGK